MKSKITVIHKQKPIKRVATYIKHVTNISGTEKRVAVTNPAQLSAHDWRIALVQAKKSLSDKKISILSAGVAYFATLAFFPLLAASVAIAAFVIDGNQLHVVVSNLETYLPTDISTLLTSQLKNAVGHTSKNVLVAVFAILLSLFSVSGAVQNLINAMNSSYETKETRNFIKLRLTSLFLTLGLLVVGFVAIVLLLVNVDILRQLHLPNAFIFIFPVLRWVVLAGIIGVGLAIVYRYAPSRANPHWQWVSWGAGISTVVWLIGTTLFFIYAKYFANFSNTYSLFAGIIVLMAWLNLSAFIILLGAEINYGLESRTTRKTTK